MVAEFHKPFIKNLVFVAFVTIVAMVSSRYLATYYAEHSSAPTNTPIYTSAESQNYNK